jgi:ribosomal protein S18 acetylase RimI-like enzyme
LSQPYVIEALGPQHDRAGFSCGVDALDDYFRQSASQDVKRRVAKCYVLQANADPRPLGYYTLSASSLPLTDVPEQRRRQLPRYPLVPVFRLGRLAVDLRDRGRALGELLVYDAAGKAIRSEAGVFGLLVDAKNARAAEFYKRLGFEPVPSNELALLLPLATFKAALP